MYLFLFNIFIHSFVFTCNFSFSFSSLSNVKKFIYDDTDENIINSSKFKLLKIKYSKKWLKTQEPFIFARKFSIMF